MYGQKENSFNAPEGVHRMKIASASLGTDRHGNDRLRLVGDLVSIKSPVTNYQAGVNYSEGSAEMLPHLYAIMGPDVVDVVDQQGGIIPQGLEKLRGKECDVRIRHVDSEKHKNPFCKIEEVAKAGRLIRE